MTPPDPDPPPPGDRPLLAAVLVVRDEASQLADCLAGLVGLVDENVVYDTGSLDDTVELARSAGARAFEGYWDDDFSRARNLGLELADAAWVLVLDADERVRADPPRLRALLESTPADVLTVTVCNLYPEEFGGSYRHPGARLLRRGAVRYVGRVHEQPRPLRAGPGRTARCATALMQIDHLGYADAAVVRAKATRNAAIAQAELERLRGEPEADPHRMAKVLLDLGRSLVVSQRRREAEQAFRELRMIAPRSRHAVEGTDALARLQLAAGQDQEVLRLAEELRSAGTDGRYCDWLRAQALAHLGRAGEGLVMLRGIDVLRDSAGRELDLGQVLEMRALVAALCGSLSEASQCLAEAMAGYGRIVGRGPLLLDLWGDRPATELASLLASSGSHLKAVAGELAGCRPPGPAAATALESGPLS